MKGQEVDKGRAIARKVQEYCEARLDRDVDVRSAERVERIAGFVKHRDSIPIRATDQQAREGSAR